TADSDFAAVLTVAFDVLGDDDDFGAAADSDFAAMLLAVAFDVVGDDSDFGVALADTVLGVNGADSDFDVLVTVFFAVAWAETGTSCGSRGAAAAGFAAARSAELGMSTRSRGWSATATNFCGATTTGGETGLLSFGLLGDDDFALAFADARGAPSRADFGWP